jgi:transcriptional regulator with XRE-family HTH domain
MDTDFKSRLKVAIGGESVNSFAKKCDVRESLLRKYLAGTTTPGTDKLIAIAEAANVKIEWLATGHGPMTTIRGRDDVRIDKTFVPEILSDNNSFQLLTVLRAYMLFTQKKTEEMNERDLNNVTTLHHYFIKSGFSESLTIPIVHFYLTCLEHLSMKVHLGKDVGEGELFNIAHDVFHSRWGALIGQHHDPDERKGVNREGAKSAARLESKKQGK